MQRLLKILTLLSYLLIIINSERMGGPAAGFLMFGLIYFSLLYGSLTTILTTTLVCFAWLGLSLSMIGRKIKLDKVLIPIMFLVLYTSLVIHFVYLKSHSETSLPPFIITSALFVGLSLRWIYLTLKKPA